MEIPSAYKPVQHPFDGNHGIIGLALVDSEE
jgi:hypothetical protein